jgi:PhnB protein
MPGSLHLYVNDADATYQRALQAGATSIMEPADQFYGDRSAGVQDTVGNRWWIATHREDVPPEELRRRADAFMQQQRSG